MEILTVQNQFVHMMPSSKVKGELSTFFHHLNFESRTPMSPFMLKSESTLKEVIKNDAILELLDTCIYSVFLLFLRKV